MAKTFDPPKGTRDVLPEEMRQRQAVLDGLRAAFERFGYDPMDTPAFEALEVLTLKAGAQAEQEIYAFDDKAGRRLGLRFDLTSSTGRIMASHPELKRPVYRYQIGKVWRYDRPAAGRYREFYQADADIIGSYSQDCEVELFLLADHVLSSFGLNQSLFLLNHRKLLDGQLRYAGLPPEKKALSLRALDKLDKIGLEAVFREAEQYEIPLAAFAKFVEILGVREQKQIENPEEYLASMDVLLRDEETGRQGVSELRYIFEQAKHLGLGNRLRLDPTLARGLDYYTGPIFEVKAGVGQGLLSFAGGGRYDDLIGLYGGQPQGAVGFSFGVERLIDLIRAQGTLGPQTRPVLVGALQPSCMASALRLAMELRQEGLPVRVAVQAQSPGKHIQYAESTGLDHVIFVGEQEQKTGLFSYKRLSTHESGTYDRFSLVQQLRAIYF